MIPRILKVRLKKFENIFMLIVYGRNFRRAKTCPDVPRRTKTVFVHLYLTQAFCLIKFLESRAKCFFLFFIQFIH